MPSYHSFSDEHSGYNHRYHAKIARNHGFELAPGGEESRTLWVGNLDSTVTDELIATLFNQMGTVTRAKMIFDHMSPDPFAFVEFFDHAQASQARQSMNGRNLMNKEMRVNWATEPSHSSETRKIDSSRHFHVFVGDLSTEIDSQKLKEAFLPYGEVSDAKIILDTTTNKAKGYGFVSYPRREDAERAIEQMNGQWLGRRTIRTNWASRKPDEEGGLGGGGMRHFGGGYSEKTYDEIYSQTTPDNTSVYVGNISSLTEEEIRGGFDRFGTIIEVRIFKLQGYSFVKYEKKESAARAIVQMNNQEINGHQIRCSWGKSGSCDSPKPPMGGPANNHYGYGYGSSGGGGASSNGPTVPPAFIHGTYVGGTRGGVSGGTGGHGSQQNTQYWQYYAQYYNNPQLMQQWTNYWQGASSKAPPPPPPAN